MSEGELAINDYKLVRNDALNRRTGGVIIYVHESISFSIVSQKQFSLSWFLAIKINRGLKNGIYGVIYKSPQEKLNEFVTEFGNWCEEITSENTLNVIVGDFNINILKKDNNSKKLIEMAKEYNLQQLVKNPTRETNNTSTIIDLVFSNDKKITPNVINFMNITDHNFIEIDINHNQEKPNYKKTITDWTNYKKELMVHQLKSVNWYTYYEYNDVDSKANFLISKLSQCLNNQLSQKTINSNKHKKWFNSRLSNLRKKVTNARQKYNVDKNDKNWFDYKHIRNIYKCDLKQTECRYIQNQISINKVNGKKLWRTLKSMYKCKNKSNNAVKFDNVLVTGEMEVAQKFNEYFVDSVANISVNIPNAGNVRFMETRDSVIVPFTFKLVDETIVKCVLKKISSSKMYDNINGKVLVDCCESSEFVSAFTNLLNCSFIDGVVPKNWKISTVIPINKVENALNAEDFRPINMLPVYEKSMEMIVKSQLLLFIKSNHILHESQSGFRENHSCETAINFVLSEWKDYTENKKLIIAVFLDFKRAFETINRDLLVEKLYNCGFDDTAVKWFKNYLTDRKQQTKIGNIISNMTDCTTGVPQGSILGPLLFIIYINDMIKIVKNCKLKLFADDSLLYVECNDVNEGILKLNEDLTTIYAYLCFNKLSLNVKKTKAMIIGRNTITPMDILKINNEAIEFVEEIKYLGIIIDKKLDFNSHLDYVCKKINKKYHMLRRLKMKLTTESMIILYNSLIGPHIDYCSTILFLLNDTQLKKIQKIQNKIMRLILNVRWDTHIREMVYTLQWQTIKQRIYFNTIKFLYKIDHEKMPGYMKRKLTKRKSLHNYDLRRKSDFNRPDYLTKNAQNSLFYKGLTIYNKFKNEYKNNITDFNDFKRKCSNFVKNQYF
jgi:hypothetical protein